MNPEIERVGPKIKNTYNSSALQELFNAGILIEIMPIIEIEHTLQSILDILPEHARDIRFDRAIVLPNPTMGLSENIIIAGYKINPTERSKIQTKVFDAATNECAAKAWEYSGTSVDMIAGYPTARLQGTARVGDSLWDVTNYYTVPDKSKALWSITHSTNREIQTSGHELTRQIAKELYCSE